MSAHGYNVASNEFNWKVKDIVMAKRFFAGVLAVVILVFLVFWVLPKWSAYLDSISNPPPATDAECKKVFEDSLQGFFGPSMDGVIKRCAGRLEPLVATVHSNYRIVGSSLQIGDAVYSSQGMVVENSSATFRDVGVTIPDVRVSVSGKNISLLFGNQSDADRAFAEIATLIARVKN